MQEKWRWVQAMMDSVGLSLLSRREERLKSVELSRVSCVSA